MSNIILCGNAGENVYLTFKGGCRGDLTYQDCYRCTGCGGRFHKDCILKHFELEEQHDWGRQAERKALLAAINDTTAIKQDGKIWIDYKELKNRWEINRS